jgi:hypothetical protein
MDKIVKEAHDLLVDLSNKDSIPREYVHLYATKALTDGISAAILQHVKDNPEVLLTVMFNLLCSIEHEKPGFDINEFLKALINMNTEADSIAAQMQAEGKEKH